MHTFALGWLAAHNRKLNSVFLNRYLEASSMMPMHVIFRNGVKFSSSLTADKALDVNYEKEAIDGPKAYQKICSMPN